MKGLNGFHPLMILVVFLALGLSGAAFWVSLLNGDASAGGFFCLFVLCWKVITGD